MKKQKISIGLLNPKSPTNVGAVLRAANCYNVDSIYYTGTRYDRAEKLGTDTKNAIQHIGLNKVENLLDSVPANTKRICVELVEGATPLPDFSHPENAIYIFGPEDNTIDQNIIDKADAVIYIPTKSCMNLAATVNVVLYDRLAKSDISYASDELIHQIRDTNNNTKIKS